MAIIDDIRDGVEDLGEALGDLGNKAGEMGTRLSKTLEEFFEGMPRPPVKPEPPVRRTNLHLEEAIKRGISYVKVDGKTYKVQITEHVVATDTLTEDQAGVDGQKAGMTNWVQQLVIRDGPNCHLCGYPVPLNRGCHMQIAPSRDHLIPNPLTKTSGYRKRQYPDAGLTNIRLAHRFCNAARGQLVIDAALQENIRVRLLKKMRNVGLGCGEKFFAELALKQDLSIMSAMDKEKRVA